MDQTRHGTWSVSRSMTLAGWREPHARCELQQAASPAGQWLNRIAAGDLGLQGVDLQGPCRARQGSNPLEPLEPPLLQETANVTAAARTQARPPSLTAALQAAVVCC